MKNFRASMHQLLFGKRPYISIAFVVAMLALSALTFAAANVTSDVSAPIETPARQAVSLAPQNAASGEWTAEVNRKEPGKIQFTFHRRSEKGGFNMTGDTLSLSEFQGLTMDAMSSPRTNVNFSIVREAGTFVCEGYFREGKGAGFWTLTTNPNFVSAMRSRGYDRLDDEDLLRAALHNLTTKYVDDLKAAGYDRLEFSQLNRAATHDITLQFIREMQSAGYQGLTMDELIRARNHDVDSAYVKEVRAMGFDKQPLESLIRLRNHEITQGFIDQMRSAGFENLSIEELIRLKNHDITAEFVNELKAEGYAPLSPEVAVRLKNHDVDRDFIRRVKAKGFTNLSLEQLIRLRSQDIVH
jgi:hypothetical protein